MIYSVKVFLLLIAVVAVSAVMKFPLQKVDNRQFVAGILARAAKGMK